ncbi:glycosyltransferase [Aquimarina sp. MMG016]|uniref:glycosyltransferase n=1 Tax=Aquimarina sp. MMG016 TaxID=2822690 RepID=UPI001B3A756A|nr:glycosyltransferase [Aquimarina sp. MMG016]MBQ4819570.1 glycosyltransferase [Aquimarina sp. MMG016]
MKRILLIIPYGGVGGMERLAFSFYNYYKSQGHFIKAVKFIKLDTDIINFGEDELYFSDKDYVHMSKPKRLAFNIIAPLRLRKLIKKHKITHSIAFGDPPNFYSSVAFTNEFKIGSMHALKSVELSNNSMLSKLTRFGFKNTYTKFDKLVCISKAIKEDLLENCGYPNDRNLEVIYNPHDVQEIQRRSKESLDEEEEQLFGDKTILFLGRLSTQKSPWHLIKAFSLVLKKEPEAKLAIIGDGDPSVVDHLKKLISDLGIENNIVFLGRKSNPYKYLVRARALALASHYEGTPNVIVEAICLETPIVSSNCTEGIVELMSLKQHPEVEANFTVESGIITPNLFKGKLGIPDNDDFIPEEELLAKALQNILSSDEYKKHLKNNKEALLAKFDLEKVANQYLEKRENIDL